MKIQVVSDLHLEFGPIEIKNNGADVLILSGDICVADSFEDMLSATAQRYISFFNQVCKDFKHVIYVLGNHEHYHGNYATTTSVLRRHFKNHINLHILDIGYYDLDSVRFVGGTLWTDFDRGDPIVKWDAQKMMMDYRGVLNGEHADPYSGPKFLPDDAVMYHEAMLSYIKEQTKTHNKIVVVGHHAPSFLSIEGKYVGDRLNGAYASDLTDFIMSYPQIKVWTHGHVHASHDYMVGTTRVVCNPRGYCGYEENKAFEPGKIIEV